MIFVATVDACMSALERGDMLSKAPTNSMTAFRKTVETFIAGAKTLPQRYFVSPEVFAEEQAKIFARQWACVDTKASSPGQGITLVSK